jgi:hypothetical protein
MQQLGNLYYLLQQHQLYNMASSKAARFIGICHDLVEDMRYWVGLVPLGYPYGMLRSASRPIIHPFSSFIPAIPGEPVSYCELKSIKKDWRKRSEKPAKR